jgi:hypothetical protein
MQSRPRVFQYDTVDSTNNAPKRLVADGVVASSACVLAREQTDGRSTRRRHWISPRDAGFYLSLVELPELHPLLATTEYTTAVGRACADCLRRETVVDVWLRGVNDLFVGQFKLGYPHRSADDTRLHGRADRRGGHQRSAGRTNAAGRRPACGQSRRGHPGGTLAKIGY